MEDENQPKEKEVAAPQPVIAGEIHIVTDPATGAISVNAPLNVVAALGLIEVAKAIIMENHRQNLQRQAPSPRIVKAGADALAKLKEGVH